MAEISDIVVAMRPSSSEVTPETSIGRDLGLDSVEVMDFVMTLEDRLDISIPLDQIAEVETVQDLCTVIEKIGKGGTA